MQRMRGLSFILRLLSWFLLTRDNFLAFQLSSPFSRFWSCGDSWKFCFDILNSPGNLICSSIILCYSQKLLFQVSEYLLFVFKAFHCNTLYCDLKLRSNETLCVFTILRRAMKGRFETNCVNKLKFTRNGHVLFTLSVMFPLKANS